MPPLGKKQKQSASGDPKAKKSTSKKGKAAAAPEESSNFDVDAPVASSSTNPQRRVNPKQTAKIFEVSIEVFMEILSYFPTVPIPTNPGMAPLLHPCTMERTEALRVLSQTCQSFRNIFLDTLWQRVDVCTVKTAFANQKTQRGYQLGDDEPGGSWYIAISELLLKICKGLLASPNHASRVQIVNVALTRCNSEAVLGTLVRCLKALPNLHTLQIYRAHPQMTAHFRNNFEGHVFPQIRTAILPTHAHNVLRCCPHVTTVVCNEGDSSQLVSAIGKVCKKVEVIQDFSADDPKLAKRIAKAAPSLRIIRIQGKATPEIRKIFSSIKDLKFEEIEIVRGPLFKIQRTI